MDLFTKSKVDESLSRLSLSWYTSLSIMFCQDNQYPQLLPENLVGIRVENICEDFIKIK